MHNHSLDGLLNEGPWLQIVVTIQDAWLSYSYKSPSVCLVYMLQFVLQIPVLQGI